MRAIYLASSSPRRRLLLEQIGVTFDCLTVDVDENCLAQEDAAAYATRLAVAKAVAGWESPLRLEARPVLGADTIVVCDGEILGKPKDKNDGLRMLMKLSGKTHQVITAIALAFEGRTVTALSVSRVSFRELSSAEAEAYWASGEPLDKAGSYAIQGKGAIFVKEIVGSYSGIMGLPLYETSALLENNDEGRLG